MVTAQLIDQCNDVELSQDLFWEFCLYYDYKFFIDRAFLEEVADAFQWVYDEYIQGRARSIAVSLPPRAGKSYITSLFAAWWMGKLPELSVMRNCSTAALYEKLSYDTRKIVMSAKYQRVFPHAKLADDKKNLAGWNLKMSKQVGYFGAGVGGQIIGFGANLAIYDDLYKGIEDALSENGNSKTLRWKGADHNSRKELDCPEIGIGTRWRKGDVIGDEIEKGNVDKIIKIAALYVNEAGELVSFCEAVNKTSFYLKEKRDLPKEIFDAEYMQEEVEMQGLMFPTKELQYYNPHDIDLLKISIFRCGVIDPAKGGGDDYAFLAGYLVKDKIYIHDVIYNNDGSDINELNSVEFIKRNNLNKVTFEGNSAWYVLGESIRRKLQAEKSNCTFRIGENSENKHTRILAQSAFVTNHFLFRDDYEKLPQYNKFMKNLTSYLKVGGNLHDDGPDVAAELAKLFRSQYKSLW